MVKGVIRFKNKSVSKTGFKNPNWKGGKIIDGKGYILILKPDHPFANYYGYVFEHRLVYEEYYNCLLLPYTLIHHIDGNIKNNSIQNLQPCYRGEHNRLEKTKDMSNRSCFLCNSKTTYIDKRYYAHWFKYKNTLICKYCYSKIEYEKRKIT